MKSVIVDFHAYIQWYARIATSIFAVSERCFEKQTEVIVMLKLYKLVHTLIVKYSQIL